jgi:anti-anti-sigma factor
MAMNITVNETGGVHVVEIEGDLDTGTSPEAQEKLSAIMEQGGIRMLIDMEKMNYISSAGLRVLLVLARESGASRGAMRICGLNDMAREVFDISGFSSILDVYETREQALENF